jgi:hypothetical protein
VPKQACKPQRSGFRIWRQHEGFHNCVIGLARLVLPLEYPKLHILIKKSLQFEGLQHTRGTQLENFTAPAT